MNLQGDERVAILGVGISPVNLEQAVDRVMDHVRSRVPTYICLAAAHVLMEGYYHPELRGILNSSGMTGPDGMSLVWLLKLRGHRCTGRVYGPDLLLAVCQRGLEAQAKHFLLGGAAGEADRLAARLKTRYPRLVIVGTYSPPLRSWTPEEERAVCTRINSSGADIVWVGIGSPRQEVWMNRSQGELKVPVQIGVGAAFDFLSGVKPQAPRWMQRAGLEWLFRLVTEPRRLGGRYAQYLLFGLLVLAEAIGLWRADPGPVRRG